MTIDTDIGKHPISDDLPAGTDIRDSTEFEQIQSEIDKLSAISGSGAVDWVLITSLCETIIASKSTTAVIQSRPTSEPSEAHHGLATISLKVASTPCRSS